MKTSLFAICLAAVACFSSTLAKPLKRRDNVSCQQKYIGTLHAVRLGGGYGAIAGTPNDTVTLADDRAKTLTIDAARVAAAPMRFQFDECTTQGWNKNSFEYGQVKPVDLAKDVQCVTVQQKVANGFSDNVGHGPRELFVHGCGSYNGGILQRQWFSAKYYDTNETYVELELTGNPNAPYSTDVRPDVLTFDDDQRGVKGAVATTPLDEPVPMTLVLYNVEVVKRTE